MLKIVAIKVGKVIKKEMTETCSDAKESVFKDKSLNAMENFNWGKMAADLRRTAPVMAAILENSIASKSTDEPTLKTEIKMTVAAGILLQGISERASHVQRVVSLLLFSSHSPKQLCY